jgi:hypothetical protein
MANKTTINGDTPRFCVINPDGSYAGIFCISYEEALEMQSARDGRIIYELREIGA